MRQLFTLALGGDVMLGRLVNEAIRERGVAYPWGNVTPLLNQVDLFGVNLECALTAQEEPWHDGGYKVFYFRADPPAAATLQAGRVNFVSVANNHSGDFGPVGMLETLEHLEQAGIAHAGAGRNQQAAQTPAIIQTPELRLGVVAFADYPAVWAATPETPGFNYTPVSVEPEDFAPVARAIAAARSQADLVLFSIHWGPNMRLRPTPEFRAFARQVIAAGADIFWGHSAHLVQGIEVYRQRLILYDTGDLIDDYAVDQELRNDLSALFLVRIGLPAAAGAPMPIGVDLAPLRIDHMQVNLAPEYDGRWFLQRLSRLCAELGTTLELNQQEARVLVT